MYYIIPISDKIKEQYPLVKDYNLWQYLGENKISAILCSILHYLLNRRIHRSLDYFISVKANYKQQNSQEISKILKESLQKENPIKDFFENLQKFDKNNIKTEVFLQEFCHCYQLTQGGQVCLKRMGDFLDLNIKVIPSLNSFGKGKENIIIIRENEKYYFIIPEPQLNFETQVNCYSCNMKVSVFMKTCCNHVICCICLQKQLLLIEQGMFQCRCGQVISKIQIELFQNEINTLMRDNQFNVLLEKFYYQQNSHLINKKNSISSSIINYKNNSLIEQFTATEIQVSLLDQTDRILGQIDEACYECKKESNKPYFFVRSCTHKFCIDCISKEFSNEYCGGCYCLGCHNKIAREEYELYLEQISIKQQQENTKSQKAEDSCCLCYQTFSYTLFKVISCQHSYCNACIENMFTVNNFIQYQCQFKNCYGVFLKDDYYTFKKGQTKLDQVSFTQLEETCNETSFNLNLITFCIKCQNIMDYSKTDVKNEICSNCRNSNKKSHLLNKEANQKIQNKKIINNFQQEDQDIDWILFTNKCQNCLKESEFQLFQVPLCNHKFCNQCLQNSIYKKQREYKCLDQQCGFLFSRRSYQNYQNNLIQDKEIINAHKIIEKKQQQINIQSMKQITTQKQFEQYQIQINQTQEIQPNIKSQTGSTTDLQECSYCLKLNETDQLFKLPCQHHICKFCCLNIVNIKPLCSKCVFKTDNKNLTTFLNKQSYQCDTCQKINQKYSDVLQPYQCEHILCTNCLDQLQNIDLFSNRFPQPNIPTIDPPQFCQVNNCNKSLKENQLISLQQNKRLRNQNEKHILKQGQIKNQNIKKAEFEKKEYKQCTRCKSDYDEFNKPVMESCNMHHLGVCCMLNSKQFEFNCRDCNNISLQIYEQICNDKQFL